MILFCCYVVAPFLHDYSESFQTAATQTAMMNQRLSEILNEIDRLVHQISELQTEGQTIIQTSSSNTKHLPVVLLNFNDAAQTIGWKGNLLRLAKKSYWLVKTLWMAKRHRATITKLESCVWKGTPRKGCFIERHAICSMINRTRKKLEEVDFPYKIKTLKTKIKNHAKPQIKGWQLVCAQRTKKY
ncbi:MAG: hypothetical protein LBE12_10365 [Planctomycetaceae bacterium]|nr:hypothetical protein [Planctomycetaceae bacterium]